MRYERLPANNFGSGRGAGGGTGAPGRGATPAVGARQRIERMFTILDAARSDMESGLRYLVRNRDNLTATQRRDAAGLQRAYLKTNNSREGYQRKCWSGPDNGRTANCRRAWPTCGRITPGCGTTPPGSAAASTS